LLIRTLLVDDDAYLRGLMKKMLVHLEVQVVAEFGNGAGALAWLKQQDKQPDIVICDLNMPEMDGVEFLRHLAALGFQGGVGLISGTGHHILSTADHLGRTLGLVMLGGLVKPFKGDALATMIKQFCSILPVQATQPSYSLSEDELRQCIASGWVVIECQPQVSVQERKLQGVEVLVRIQHPEYGLLPPASFIDVAESSGMIVDITEAAFKPAVYWCDHWNKAGQSIKVSVNISMGDFKTLDLPEKLARWALERHVDHQQMVIELTETRLVENLSQSLDITTRLRIKGFGLSIDDFGTGYSTLNKLKHFPFTELKIDREFVNGAEHNPVTRAILESSVHLAKALNLTIVAEGADSQQDWDFVASLGVDLVQGFFVSRPMPPDQVVAWKKAWEGSASAETTGAGHVAAEDN